MFTFPLNRADAQALSRNLAPGKLAIGQSVTRGLGAGGVPMVGRKAAEESIDDLREYLYILDTCCRKWRKAYRVRSTLSGLYFLCVATIVLYFMQYAFWPTLFGLRFLSVPFPMCNERQRVPHVSDVP